MFRLVRAARDVQVGLNVDERVVGLIQSPSQYMKVPENHISTVQVQSVEKRIM